MKTFNLQIANFVGISFLAGIAPYLTFNASLKFSVVAAVVALIAYCVFSDDKKEDTPFYFFCGSLISIVDIWVSYDNREIFSWLCLVCVLFILNSFIYWILSELFISDNSQDDKE